MFVLVLLLTNASFADETSYWQCTTSDKSNKQWVIKNKYERAARGQSFDACKKQSPVPASCETDCEGFNHGVSTRPLWQCTALDQNAKAWISQTYAQRDDAEMNAKARCKTLSSIPDSCYLNTLTCVNLNHWP